MVPILDGSTEHNANAWREKGNMTPSRHLFTSTAVGQSDTFKEITFLFYTCYNLP